MHTHTHTLHRYYPETVSKANPETADLFRQVMRYEQPRPRATEKDTKVLRWRDLRAAINKVVAGHVTYVWSRTHTRAHCLACTYSSSALVCMRVLIHAFTHTHTHTHSRTHLLCVCLRRRIATGCAPSPSRPRPRRSRTRQQGPQ
jgi:hypothetical protein